MRIYGHYNGQKCWGSFSVFKIRRSTIRVHDEIGIAQVGVLNIAKTLIRNPFCKELNKHCDENSKDKTLNVHYYYSSDVERSFEIVKVNEHSVK